MKELYVKQAAEIKTPPPETEINKWLVFINISFALLMMTIDSTIVATALHTLQMDLNTTVSWTGWTLTAYSFGFTLMLPLSAKLSIRFGHRRVFMVSIFVFTLASLFCGLSNSISHLIIMRVIQAIGGAGITPAATGIIVEHFGSARAQFLGLFGSIFPIGAIIGPIFGGIIVTYWSWPWIFYINIPLGITVLVLALSHIPKDVLKETKSEKLDFKGLVLMATAILSGMYGATYLAETKDALVSPLFIGLAVVCAASVMLLFLHLNKVKKPFIRPRFIFGKGFGAVNIVNFIYSGMIIGSLSLVPLYAINRFGISELHSGTLLIANGLASVVLSTILSIYINRTGYRMPLYAGGFVLVLGMGLLSLPPQFGIPPYFWLMVSTFFIGAGLGIMSPAARNAGISLAPEQSANLAAIRSIGVQLGQIVTIAGATAFIAGSQNPVETQAIVYAFIAAFLLFVIGFVVPKVPESKGAW